MMANCHLFWNTFLTTTLPLSCQWITFFRMIPGLEQHSCNGCGVLKVLWHAQLSFGRRWDHREQSVTTLLLHICIDHFIRKENKGILQVLDTYHHWNVANLLFEGREKNITWQSASSVVKAVFWPKQLH